MKRLEIEIYGKVQGVFFRDGAKKVAESRLLKGYAENLADGSLKIVAEGEEWDLRELLEWAKKGPEKAEIEKVEPHWSNATGEFSEFKVK